MGAGAGLAIEERAAHSRDAAKAAADRQDWERSSLDVVQRGERCRVGVAVAPTESIRFVVLDIEARRMPAAA